MLNVDLIEKLSLLLKEARSERREIDRLTRTHPALDIDTAYRIQWKNTQEQESRGDQRVGYKMGLTSQAKIKQMGVKSPILGTLQASMQIPSGAKLNVAQGIHPKVEPEIAFGIKKQLHWPCTLEEVREACEWVSGALEIIDSRFKNFEFELPDVIADNCSGHGFVLGMKRVPLSEVPFENLGIILEKDGVPVQYGSSAAILGNPLLSVMALIELLDSQGIKVEAGSVVLAGAATAAIALEPGHRYSAQIQKLGKVELLT